MQRTGHLSTWHRLFKIAKSLLPLVALLNVAGTTAQAGEPIMVLASAKTLSASDKIFTASHKLPQIDNVVMEKAKPVVSTVTQTSMNLETTTISQRENLLIANENLVATSRPNNWVNVQAGYGRLWNDDAVLEKISAGHQEPGCAYVKANFSF